MISFATLHVGVGHGNPCLKRYAYVQRDDAELTCLAFATCRAEIWGAYSTESRQLLIFSPLTGRHSQKAVCCLPQLPHPASKPRSQNQCRAPQTQHPSRRNLTERMSPSITARPLAFARKCRIIAVLLHEVPRNAETSEDSSQELPPGSHGTIDGTSHTMQIYDTLQPRKSTLNMGVSPASIATKTSPRQNATSRCQLSATAPLPIAFCTTISLPRPRRSSYAIGTRSRANSPSRTSNSQKQIRNQPAQPLT